MSALLSYLDELIRKQGPISLADYMQLALQHPEHGYYRKGDPLGAEGDFVTAPEISQMFGEMIGLWCADVWRQMGSPDAFVLLELGPGHGTLMQDALRATAKIKGFHAAMQLHLIESNITLRKRQDEKLSGHLPIYVDDIGMLPALPLIVIANEFFDALPIRQFEKTFQGWTERRVTIDRSRLGFTHVALDAALLGLIPQEMHEATIGTTYEISMASIALTRDLAKHIARQSGAALFIDYGYVESSGRATLQAIADQKMTDVFQDPGEADVTAHVDFAALKRTAEAQNLTVLGPIGQGEFLGTLGIELRADQLKMKADPSQAEAIVSGLYRLTDASQMGSLFKVMAMVASHLRQVPGF